jgi:hypothetical protein
MCRLIAITLAVTLCLPAEQAAKPDIRAVALEIPTGVPVRIRTVSKQTIHGKLTAVTPDGVTLQVLEEDRITERAVPFTGMKSIKQTNKPMSGGKVVLITLGVLYAIGALIGLAIGG